MKNYNDVTLNFTKTSIQARADGQIKPRAYNAWDVLALNDLINNKIEEQQRKERERNQRIQMRQFYDTQVAEKNNMRQMDFDNDRRLGQMIKERT